MQKIYTKIFSANKLVFFISIPLIVFLGLFVFKSNINFIENARAATGLTAAYNFNEGAGTVANDISGNGNNGTLINNPTWSTGKNSGGVSLNGTNNHIRIASPGIFEKQGDFTISFWAYPQFFNSLGTTVGTIILADSSSPGYVSHLIFKSSWGVNSIEFDTSSSWNISSYQISGSWLPSQWVNVALVFDSQNNLGTFYINGAARASSAISKANFGSTHSGYELGVDDNYGLTDYFLGKIDDFRIYNRALSGPEIQADMNSPVGSNNTNPSDTTPPAPPSGVRVDSQTPPSDTASPSVPANLSASVVSSSQINLSWSASSDNTGVTGYKIYRNGTQISTSQAASFQNTGLSPSTSYSYTVSAYDAAGNNSSQSNSSSATTQANQPNPGSLSALTVNDLTWKGQVGATGTTYANLTLAIRYVNGERRFLTYQFDSSQPDKVGDLIEYKITASLKNGASDWTINNVPAWTEVRRWKNWSTRDRMIAAGTKYGKGQIFGSGPLGGNGVWPSSFYWDEAHGVLWYTWQPQYPGGSVIWPAYNAVRLVDSEAGGRVSDSNIYGPYYFRANNIYDDFKDAAAGIIPIPADRQAAMGGKYLIVGHHAANNGNTGPHGVGMWVVNDLPNPPAQDSVLWPNAVHIYDTSTNSGLEKPNMKEPNISYQAANHASQGTVFHQEHNGIVSLVPDGGPVGLTVGDSLYQHDYGNIDTIAIYMRTGASGGAWVPEIYNGSAWVQPSNWAIAKGDAALSGTENVFYWPKTTVYPSSPGGLEFQNYVRLRRISAGSSGGSIDAIVTTTSLSDSEPYPYRPEGMGGHQPLGSEQYDSTHYAYAYEEGFWGGAWVQTNNVDGLAYFGSLKVGGIWYGAAPMWAQPKNGGVPTKYELSTTVGSVYSNGGKVEGPIYPYFFPFNSTQLTETAAGTRPRNNTGLNPASYDRLFEDFPGLIVSNKSQNPNSPYYGQPTFNIYGTGQTVIFDPVTNQLIVLLTNGATWSQMNILAFWQVR